MKKPVISLVALLLMTTLPSIAQATTPDEIFSTVTNSVGLTKLFRFFTFNQIGKAELTLAIDNRLLIQAKEQLTKGEPEKASATLTEFQDERNSLHTQMASILNGTLDHAETNLVRDIVTDETAELESLREIKPGQIANLKALQDESVSHINTILEKSSLSEEERAIEVISATSKASETVGKPEEKVAIKLALKNDLEDVATNDKVKTELANEEDRNVAIAASLSTPQIESLVTLLSDEKPKHNLVVLQKLLVQAPENAKAHLETALGDSAEKEVTVVETNKNELKELGANDHIPFAIRTAVLEHVKGKAKNDILKNTVDQVASDSQKIEDIKIQSAAPEIQDSLSSGDSQSVSGSKKTPPPTSSPAANHSGEKKDNPSSTPATAPKPLGTSSPHAEASPVLNASPTPAGSTEIHHSEPSPLTFNSTPPSSPIPTSGVVEGSGGSGSGSSGSGSSGSSGSGGTTLHSIRSYYDVISLQVPATPISATPLPTPTDSSSSITSSSSSSPVAGIAALLLAIISFIFYIIVRRKKSSQK